MQKTNDERTHLWDERAAPVIELTGMRAESNSRGCIVRRVLRAHRWVVVVVGEERIFAGHDVSWSAASEVGIIVELERARSFIANF